SGDPVDLGAMPRHRLCEAILELTTAIGDVKARAVGRILRFALQVSIRLHIAELIAQLEGEGTVLVEDEVEVEGHVGEHLEEVGGFLDVSLPGPAVVLPHGAGKPGDQGILRHRVHSSSSSFCSSLSRSTFSTAAVTMLSLSVFSHSLASFFSSAGMKTYSSRE